MISPQNASMLSEYFRLLLYDAGIISKYFKVHIFVFYEIFNNLKAILLTFINGEI